MVTVYVSGTVDEPGNVQNESPTEHCCYKPCIFQCFTPEIPWNQCWQDETSNWHQNQVISLRKKTHTHKIRRLIYSYVSNEPTN